MKLITVSGPPSCGKTTLLIRTVLGLKAEGFKAGVVKFDCLASSDEKTFLDSNIPAKVGLSGGLCPDHFYISNIEKAHDWGKRQGFDYLFLESAGLCNRCSPHLKNILAVCVIDNLSGLNTPYKIGPMLRGADIAVITKGDIVSQAEREVFAFRVRQVNRRARIIPVNALTGQGVRLLINSCAGASASESLEGYELRFTMPAALCSYCLGETAVGTDKQIGLVKYIDFADSSEGSDV